MAGLEINFLTSSKYLLPGIKIEAGNTNLVAKMFSHGKNPFNPLTTLKPLSVPIWSYVRNLALSPFSHHLVWVFECIWSCYFLSKQYDHDPSSQVVSPVRPNPFYGKKASLTEDSRNDRFPLQNTRMSMSFSV